jgi:Flp pilus assembly protein TadD
MAFYRSTRDITPAAVAFGIPALLLSGLMGCSPINSTAPKISDSTRLTLADIASSGGDVESARSILKAAAEQEPNNAEVQFRYANALLEAGRPAEASAVGGKVAAAHPQDIALALKVGQLQLLAKDAAGAAVTFDRAAAHTTDSVAALNGLGVARVQQGDLTSAADAFRRAVALRPSDLAARNNLALALVLQGRAGEAVPMLQSLANEPGSPGRVKHNLAMAYAEQGNTRQAAAVLTDVVGPAAALQEAASLAIVGQSSPASIMSQLAPVELLGPGHAAASQTSSSTPGPAAPAPLAPQSAVQQPEQPIVATAPRQEYRSAPLPPPQSSKATVPVSDTAPALPPSRPLSSAETSGRWHEPKMLVVANGRPATDAEVARQFAAADAGAEAKPDRHTKPVRVQISEATGSTDQP